MIQVAALSPTLPTYDELPYDSLPLPEAHPEYLAAIARLHGFAAADPRRARVLELGCASGGNLLPIAWYAPDSPCIGIELSRVQAEAGQALTSAAGIVNARILHDDLAALPESLGEFDYIIAHGLYSWVSPAVQSAVLRLCARHLADNGIAYVSYNVLPGWSSRQALRKYLLQQVARVRTPSEQVDAARRALVQLAAEWAGSTLGRFPDLPAEIAYLEKASAGYLYHEYLADINEPLAFGEFLSRAHTQGLGYLCDAGAGLCARQVPLRAALAEQRFDEQEHTRFRRSLLIRHGSPRETPEPDVALETLAFHASLRCDEEVDLDTPTPQRFTNSRGTDFVVRRPLCKAAFIVLAAVYPESISYRDLLEAARGLLQQFGATALIDDLELFRQEWLSLVHAHATRANITTQTFFSDLSVAPRAHALARAQAASGAGTVAGAHHAALDLDAGSRDLLSLLDGGNSRIALTAKLLARCEARGEGLSVEEVAANNDRLLQLFARNALLIA